MAASTHALSLLILKTKNPVAFAGNQKVTDFEYTGPKPGGTDIGHMVREMQTGQEYLVKTGMTLGLFYQILQAQQLGNDNMVAMFFGFLAGSYERIVNSMPDTNRREKLITCFKQYCETATGRKLLEKARTESFSTQDIYSLYSSFIIELAKNDDPALRDVVCLPALGDIIKGAASQAFSNQFQSKALLPAEVPTAAIIMEKTPNDEQAALLLASGFIENAIGFDGFLINPFLAAQQEGGDDWVDRGAKQLKSNLAEKPIHGLCAAILLRHIMGEKSDNSPDNMVLINTETERKLINIDLTGFRYDRQKTNKGGAGWEDTLLAQNKAELMEKLFHPTVFSDRFVKFCKALPEEKRPEIFNRILGLIKESVAPLIKSEIREVRNWLATLDADLMEYFVGKVTSDIVEEMNDRFKPSEDAITHLRQSNMHFISNAVVVAKANPQPMKAMKGTFFGDRQKAPEQTVNLSNSLGSFQ